MYLIICILVMALITYGTRVFPFVFLKYKIESRFLKSVLYYMPYSVLGAMTFPSVFYSTGNMLYSSIGTIVALTLAYFEKSLIVVAACSVFIVYVMNFIN